MNHDTIRHTPQVMAYVWGYLFSVLLTLMAFGFAFLHTNFGRSLVSRDFLVFTVITLAVLQLFVQTVFFLHLSRHPSARHNLISFTFTVFIVLFIGIGSLWIMRNLHYNMTPQQMDSYLQKEN